MSKLYIDPGHGGSDPGAVGNGLKEKDVTLNIAKKVLGELANYDVQTSMTRTDDTYVSLSGRAQFANNYKADFFLSIHINSSANASATGFESYIHTNAGTDTAEKQRLLHYEIADVCRKYSMPDRGTKRANFAVLRETQMPAVLAEIGFINNPKEAELLRSEAFLGDVARGIVAGLVRAFSLVRKVPIAPTVIIGEKEYPAQMVNGQLVVTLPVREAFTAAGCSVEWVEDTKKCYIRRD